MRKEPAVPIVPRDELTYLGLDVHRDSISVAVLCAGDETPVIDKIFHDEPSVRRLIGRLDDVGRLRACYEAGPTGYGLARLLESMGVSCQVMAPALIPRMPGDRVKTDRRDCRRLARLFRAGELTAIRVPSPAEEGVRDLCRARTDLVIDRRRARQRLGGFLLRHGYVYREGAAWTLRHRAWLETRHFDDPAVERTFEHYLAVVSEREADVDAIDAELVTWFSHPLFSDTVARLGAYRGIDELAGLVLATEVCDWRRFATAGQFMGFCGLVPSEYSSGDTVRRGKLTKAGNVQVRTQLVESAWAYRHPARVTREIAKRQDGTSPETLARAWRAQQRLSRRFRTLDARKDSRSVVAAAVARELAGFVWAEMTA